MALYAVGDLQGSREPLELLLDTVHFNPRQDHLWLVGDLVNRGKDSLGCLRLVKSLGDAASTVLGNHDLHLLALAWADKPAKSNPGLNAIINAPDAEELLDWLRQRPLLLQDSQRRLLCTHAGIPPNWSDQYAIDRAHELESVFADKGDFLAFLNQMYGNQPDRWHPNLTGMDRWRYIINAFTRMRFCGPDGQLEFDNKEDPSTAPPGMKPWFEWPAQRQHTLVFGHWAALMGKTGNDDFIALDTGYVWQNYLTLMNLDSGQRWQCDTAGVVFLREN
ncbi:MAG: symmetrical bis(5'-nucleosyl)-tetraphosphatase [Saccharospirillum sp.]|nr:symmetrical bis(5'-nucleosyl)-tetraphosphatase [Saccharospirillum sp.]